MTDRGNRNPFMRIDAESQTDDMNEHLSAGAEMNSPPIEPNLLSAGKGGANTFDYGANNNRKMPKAEYDVDEASVSPDGRRLPT